jgi:hypothetical protein
MGAARSNRPTFSDSAAAVTKCWGLEIDETGASRKDRPSFRMADDEGRVLAAQSLGCDQHLVWFGSSAGVAISNMYPEAKSVGLWLKHGWSIAIAYIVGFFVMLAILGWYRDVPVR